MTTYGNFCPIALASEVVADRWTPLILRELFLGSTRFNDIARGLPGISRTLLTQRLKHLERKQVVERRPGPAGRGSSYHLTLAGRDLEQIVMALGSWAVHWLYQRLDPSDVDAVTLTWWMHHLVDPDKFPDERVVIEFDHTAPERVRLWLVLEHGSASLCIQHPGFEPDLTITTTTPDLGQVFAGILTWSEAVEAGSVKVDGPPRLARALPRWFVGSPFAAETRTRSQMAMSS